MAKASNLLLWGGVAIAAYLIYSKAKAATAAVSAGYNTAVNSTSDLLSTLFGPAVTLPGTFYVVTFPDGSKNAVAANAVDSSGNFTWTGYPAGSQAAQSLQLMVGTDGTKYAIAAT